ncbi:MAG: hypothetical protein AABW45_03530 [Nanoarchaeota archaeon]
MNLKSKNSYKELKTIFVIVLILTFIFGFNDNSPSFILKNWLLNLVYVFILVCLVVLFNVLGYKLTAKYLGSGVDIKLWHQHKFEKEFSLKNIPGYIISPVLGILVALFSNGRLFFTPVSTFHIKDYNVYGRKFPKLTYFNHGLIAVGGLFFSFVLMMFFKILTLEKGVSMSSWFILWNLLPFSELPGARIFFASRVMYLFSLIFFLSNIFFIKTLSVISSLVISFFFSIVLAIVYFYFVEYMKA